MKADNSLHLRNIGPDIEQWLARVGVTTKAQFDALGADKAYRLLIEAGHEPDPNLRAMLIGAEEDIDWHIIVERDYKFENSRTADVDEP